MTGDVLLLLCAFFITGTEPRNSLSDGVIASQNFFTVSNGVKQGGILSPHLFTVYMDDLRVNVNKLQIGCLYAGAIMNHMIYADDLCVFSPSVSGLRKLTDCCAEYGNMFDITHNANKYFCMVIDNKPRGTKTIHLVVINNHTLKNVNTLAILQTITLLMMTILPGRKYVSMRRQMFSQKI